MENQETNNVCVHKGGSNKILAIIAIVLSIISITMSAFTLGKISNCSQMNQNRYTTRSTQNRTNKNNNRNTKTNQNNNQNNMNNPMRYYGDFGRGRNNWYNRNYQMPNWNSFNKPKDSGMMGKADNNPPTVQNEIKAPQ